MKDIFEMVSVYDYLEYRDFLQDFYNRYKTDHPFFSYRYIAQKVGMNISYIVRIFNGTKHVSTKNISKLSSLCNLTKEESEYFEYLVYFNKAKTKKSKDTFWEKLKNIRKIEKVAISNYEITEKWYFAPVWTVLSFAPLKENYSVIANMLIPPITEEEACEAITVLLKNKLIERNENNQLLARYTYVKSGRYFNKKTRDTRNKIELLNVLKFFNEYENNTYISSHVSFYISEKKLSIIEEITQEYIDKIMKTAVEHAEKEEDTRAYLLSAIVIPQSKNKYFLDGQDS